MRVRVAQCCHHLHDPLINLHRLRGFQRKVVDCGDAFLRNFFLFCHQYRPFHCLSCWWWNLLLTTLIASSVPSPFSTPWPGRISSIICCIIFRWLLLLSIFHIVISSSSGGRRRASEIRVRFRTLSLNKALSHPSNHGQKSLCILITPRRERGERRWYQYICIV